MASIIAVRQQWVGAESVERKRRQGKRVRGHCAQCAGSAKKSSFKDPPKAAVFAAWSLKTKLVWGGDGRELELVQRQLGLDKESKLGNNVQKSSESTAGESKLLVVGPRQHHLDVNEGGGRARRSEERGGEWLAWRWTSKNSGRDKQRR
jgi:hypothetical protein